MLTKHSKLKSMLEGIIEGEEVYTLMQKRKTEELHLFKGVDAKGNECTVGSKSLCKKMTSGESSKDIFECQDEQAARMECAREGRKVCGNCVSQLYTTYS